MITWRPPLFSCEHLVPFVTWPPSLSFNEAAQSRQFKSLGLFVSLSCGVFGGVDLSQLLLEPQLLVDPKLLVLSRGRFAGLLLLMSASCAAF